MTKRSKLGWVPRGFAVNIAFTTIFIFATCLFGCAQTGAYVSAAAASSASGTASTLPVAANVASYTSANVDDDAADQPILTIKKRVDEVNVLFIATDRHGKFVRNLNQNDFSILDDHKPVESIVNFRRETDLPIEMGLLMDSLRSQDGFPAVASSEARKHGFTPEQWRSSFGVCANTESTTARPKSPSR